MAIDMDTCLRISELLKCATRIFDALGCARFWPKMKDDWRG